MKENSAQKVKSAENRFGYGSEMDMQPSENDIHPNTKLDGMSKVNLDNEELLAYPLLDEFSVKALSTWDPKTKTSQFEQARREDINGL